MPRFIAHTGLSTLLLASVALADGGPSFIPIGSLPGPVNSRALGLSADGLTVVGMSNGSAFIFRAGSGVQPLPSLPGYSDCRANGIDADGSNIVGRCGDRAVRWSAGEVFDLNTFGVGAFSSANAVAPFSLVIVGNAFNGNFSQPDTVAYRWTLQSGAQILSGATITGGNFESYGAAAASSDGSVIVGNDGFGLRAAFRWTQGGGLVPLGFLASGPLIPFSNATAVSSDGSALAGFSSSVSGPQAFRWSSGEGMVGLGDLPGGDFDSEASAISADGSIIVGRGLSAAGDEAFIWDAQHGMRNLRDVLVMRGVTGLSSWRLAHATAISADGRTIAGYGVNPGGNTEAWLVGLPAEPPCYVNCDGSTEPPVLSILDFSCFIDRFFAGDSYANCDGSTAEPVLNVNDFVCFQQQFAAGCP